MRRIRVFLVAAASAAVLSLPPLAAGERQASAPRAAATCDEAAVHPESYRLTTEAQALNVLRPREPWWQPYGIWNRASEIGDVNGAAVRLAERARELDDRNLLAHGHLARQYVILAIDAKRAEDTWRRVVDGGGAVVWTGSLYEVDPRSFFLFAFDGRGIRVYTYAQLAGELRTHFGVPDVPDAGRVEFWRALGGCLPDGAAAEAVIPWSGVREIRATASTLRMDLHERVTVESDRGRRRTDDTLEVNLHPGPAQFDFRFGTAPPPWMRFGPRPIETDPAAYHLRVKQMLEVLQANFSS